MADVSNGLFTAEELEQYHRDGYIIVRGLLDAEDAAILGRAAKADRTMQEAGGMKDGDGGLQKLSLWHNAGDDAYGLVTRSRRVVDRVEQLLDGEAYHWHTKMSIKEPFSGGAWVWHQDYGYWYGDGCLFPDLASCFIAVDPNTRENGCMQVLRGSHRLGRIEHGLFGDQTGADPARTDEAMKVLDLVYAEMAPGDALFFHCNTLHRSDQNKSENPRWSLICCYNAARNSPFGEKAWPKYEKLEKVEDNALKELAAAAPQPA